MALGFTFRIALTLAVLSKRRSPKRNLFHFLMTKQKNNVNEQNAVTPSITGDAFNRNYPTPSATAASNLKLA